MDETLLSLPLHIQVALGSGYLAYLVAYAGIRQHHTASEVFFRSIAFGMVATAIMLWAPGCVDPQRTGASPFWQAALAFLATIIVGALWRWRGMRWSRAMLRTANVSWTDDIPTAWLSITATDTKARPSQLSVELHDERLLLCEDTREFRDAPFGPCVYGLDGSVAMYVTAEQRPDGSWFNHEDVRHRTEGDRLTYIPASQIKRIELRLWTNPNGMAEREEVTAPGEAEEPEES